ncbi:MAG: hypothetical protein AAFY14_07970 [Pseudomonadota bacterium]
MSHSDMGSSVHSGHAAATRQIGQVGVEADSVDGQELAGLRFEANESAGCLPPVFRHAARAVSDFFSRLATNPRSLLPSFMRGPTETPQERAALAEHVEREAMMYGFRPMPTPDVATDAVSQENEEGPIRLSLPDSLPDPIRPRSSIHEIVSLADFETPGENTAFRPDSGIPDVFGDHLHYISYDAIERMQESAGLMADLQEFADQGYSVRFTADATVEVMFVDSDNDALWINAAYADGPPELLVQALKRGMQEWFRPLPDDDSV